MPLGYIAPKGIYLLGSAISISQGAIFHNLSKPTAISSPRAISLLFYQVGQGALLHSPIASGP